MSAIKGVKGFQKGKSGNPAGRPIGILDPRTVIARECAANNVEKVKELLMVMLEKGLGGDVPAATLALSYLLIKPKQQIDVTSNDEPIVYPTLTRAQADELARLKREEEKE